jgi:hypothetical protein
VYMEQPETWLCYKQNFTVGVFNFDFHSNAPGSDEQKYTCSMPLRLNFMDKCLILTFSEN